MDTNFQMLKKLNKEWDSKKHTMGIVSMNEIYQINEMLCLDQMDILQLRNLRDFIVLFFSRDEDANIDTMDKVSAFTAVIDNKIWNKGGEV